MSNTKITLAVIGILALFLFIGGCSVRNGIIEKSNAVDKAWSDVNSAYQRRLDLIPNLVNTVKGYAAHESETLQAVTDARVGLKSAYDEAQAQVEGSQGVTPAYMEAQSDLNRRLGLYINAVHEAYPDLKANQNFLDLQTQLEGTENRINTARNDYNTAIMEYNNSIMKFPASLVAWGFDKRQGFEADRAASKAPTVDFTGNAPAVNDF